MAPARCNQALLSTPAGGKYGKALLLLEEVGPAGGVAGGRGWRNCGDQGVSEGWKGTWRGAAGASIPGKYLVPLKLCSPGAGYPKTCWMSML